MKKSKHTTTKYKTVKEMDSSLEKMDLSELILSKGKVIKPNLDKPVVVQRRSR